MSDLPGGTKARKLKQVGFTGVDAPAVAFLFNTWKDLPANTEVIVLAMDFAGTADTAELLVTYTEN